jgi:hypothetical protein
VTEVPRFAVVEPPRSVFRRRRFFLPLWISIATALVSVIVLVTAGAVDRPWERIIIVKGLMSSKADLFNDGEIRRILMDHGIQVHVTYSGGSINIVEKAPDYDFVMPSGQMVGKIITDTYKDGNPHTPFASHLVVVAFRDYARALVDAGVAVAQSDDTETSQYFTLYMKQFVGLADPDKDPRNPRTWRQHGLASENQILAEGPEPCTSYSGAAYLAMVAFAANGANLPPTDTSRIVTKITPMWDAAGQAESKLGQTFFGPEGRSIAPVAVVYEHQYYAYQIDKKERAGDIDRDRVLLYPDTHHDTQPMLISFNNDGERVGQLIDDDPKLNKRALELGFRVLRAGSQSLEELLKERGIEEPKNVGTGTKAELPERLKLLEIIKGVRDCTLPEVPE